MGGGRFRSSDGSIAIDKIYSAYRGERILKLYLTLKLLVMQSADANRDDIFLLSRFSDLKKYI